MTIFEIQTILSASNPRPVLRFLQESGFFDFQNKKLIIEPKQLKKEYANWKKLKREKGRENAKNKGILGRPKKST